MIKLMKEITMIKAKDAVRRLARERPEWLAVLEATVAVAARSEPYGGEFAGAWVLDEMAKRGQGRWVPNLRLLASYGLIEKYGPSTRGGRRAYYRMIDREGVEAALADWRERPGDTSSRKLGFIGAGRSSDPPSDLGRQAGEIAYEPRSWR